MLRNIFWVAALGVIVAYLFFFTLGSFGFDEALPLSLAVVALSALWAIHLWLEHKHRQDLREPALVHARERRGF